MKKVKELLFRKQVGLSLALTLLLVPFFKFMLVGSEPGNNSFVSAVGVAICAGILGAIIADVLMRTFSKFQRQHADSEAGNYAVYVNGVRAGEVSRSDYAGFWLAAFQDYRVYVAQLFNVFQVLLRIADYAFIGVPVTVFWGGLAAYLYDQTMFFDMVAYIADLKHASVVLDLAISVIGISVVFSIGLGRRFGFVNQFSQHVSVQVRSRIQVVADGPMDLQDIDATQDTALGAAISGR